MGGCLTTCKKTEMRNAITIGDCETVGRLVTRQPDMLLVELEECGNSALQVAILLKQHRILKLLLSYTAASSSCDTPSKRPLQVAATRAINKQRVTNGATSLMTACEAGDAEAARLLLDHGADPWVRDRPYRRSCLHYAAANGHATALKQVIEKCQESGDTLVRGSHASSSSSQKNSSGRPLTELATAGGFTPLMYAARYNHGEAAAALVQLGANLSRRSNDLSGDPTCRAAAGSTALHVAAVNGAFEAAYAMLKEYHRQAAPQRMTDDPRLLLDNMGRTPYMVALALRQSGLIHLLNPKNPLIAVLDKKVEGRARSSSCVPVTIQQAAAAGCDTTRRQQSAAKDMLRSSRSVGSVFINESLCSIQEVDEGLEYDTSGGAGRAVVSASLLSQNTATGPLSCHFSSTSDLGCTSASLSVAGAILGMPAAAGPNRHQQLAVGFSKNAIEAPRVSAAAEVAISGPAMKTDVPGSGAVISRQRVVMSLRTKRLSADLALPDSCTLPRSVRPSAPPHSAGYHSDLLGTKPLQLQERLRFIGGHDCQQGSPATLAVMEALQAVVGQEDEACRDKVLEACRIHRLIHGVGDAGPRLSS